ncbi:proline-rich protein 2-like [Zalophus californianus]|uniref:Proline-rich protein 2-like n=1 Tax=Zalophus californianus TaxID=9704 RepID=A0A6J2DJM1_ZALCA|nr:proline-rich protein 2-like [Zalophus californianus]
MTRKGYTSQRIDILRPREPQGQERAGVPTWLKKTVAGLPGATVWVYLPAGGRRRAALKPAPPAAPEPHRAALRAGALGNRFPGLSQKVWGEGGPHGPTPRACERSSAGAVAAGAQAGAPVAGRREGGRAGAPEAGTDARPAGAGAVLLESRSSRLARPSHAATSGPPRLSDVRTHTPQAHGGPPGAPELPPDLPSALRPNPPLGLPLTAATRPGLSPAGGSRHRTPVPDTGHRTPAARPGRGGGGPGEGRGSAWAQASPRASPNAPHPRAFRAPPRAPPPPVPYNTHPVFSPSLAHPRHLPVQGPALALEVDEATPRPLGPPEAVGEGREGKAEVPASRTGWLDKHSG